MSIISKIYNPSQTVGQVYARVFGANAPRIPVGNVLRLELAHEETVARQPDMTQAGGGTYASTRRVSAVNVSMDLADWNPINFTRSVFGTVALTAAGTVTDEAQDAYLGGLIRLNHPSPTAVSVKKGATVVSAANYQVRPGGLMIPADAADVDDGDALLISYTHPEHVNIEAITTTAPELEFFFEGLNEADSGKPMLVDIWRVSLGIAGTLGLIQSELSTMTVAGEVLKDPTRSGVGLSPFYRAQMA